MVFNKVIGVLNIVFIYFLLFKINTMSSIMMLHKDHKKKLIYNNTIFTIIIYY